MTLERISFSGNEKGSASLERKPFPPSSCWKLCLPHLHPHARGGSGQYPHFTEDIEVQRSKLTFSKVVGPRLSHVKTEGAANLIHYYLVFSLARLPGAQHLMRKLNHGWYGLLPRVLCHPFPSLVLTACLETWMSRSFLMVILKLFRKDRAGRQSYLSQLPSSTLLWAEGHIMKTTGVVGSLVSDWVYKQDTPVGSRRSQSSLLGISL